MESRFRVGGVLSESFSIYFRNFTSVALIGIGTYLPLTVIAMSGSFLPGSDPFENSMLLVGMGFATIILAFFMQGAIIYGVHEHLNGRAFPLSESVQIGFRRWWPIFLVSVVSSILSGLGTLLLIVPGIMIYTALWLVVAAVVVEKRGVRAAIDRSRQLTAGYRMRIFGLLIILWIIGWAVGEAGGGLSKAMFMGVPGSPVILFLVSNMLSGLVAALGAVVTSVAYYSIRLEVEGLDLSEIASVFD